MQSNWTTPLAIGLAALQAADAAALGAQVAGLTLPPAVVFALVVASAPMAVILANLPQVRLSPRTGPSLPDGAR